MKTLAPIAFLICFFLLAFQTNQPTSQKDTDNAATVPDSLKLTGTMGDTAVAIKNLKETRRLMDKGQYNEAVSLAKQSAEICNKYFGTQNLNSALAYHQIGVCMEKLSKLDSVEFYYNKALGIKQELLGEDHPDVADVYHDLGVYFTTKAEFQKALSFLNRALEVRSSGEVDSLKLSNVYNDLGSLAVSQKEYPEAAEYFNKSLDLRLKLFGEQDALTGQSFNNLGVVYIYRGMHGKAYEVLNKGLEAKIKGLGDNNPKLIGSYMNIGIILSMNQDFEKANQYLQKALKIIQTHFGAKHQLAIRLNGNIASVLLEQKDYDNSIDYYRIAIDGLSSALGKNHPDLINAYKGIGVCYSGKKNFVKALEYFNQGIAVSEYNFGKDNVAIGNTYHAMASVFIELRRHNEAEELYNKIIDIYKKNYGNQHPLLGSYYYSLANFYIDRGNYEKARYLNALAQKSLNFDKENENYEDVLALNYLDRILDQEAKLYEDKYYETDSLNYLIKAAYANQRSIKVLDEIKKRYIEPSTQNDLISSRYSIFERGIAIYHMMDEIPDELPEKWDAFRLMEQSKALILKDAFNKESSKNYFGIPEALIEKEHDLKYNLAQLEKDRYEKSSGIDKKAKKDSIYTHYTSQIFDLEKAIDSLQIVFKNKYPEYFQINYDNNTLGIEGLRENILDENQALLSYFVGDSSIYIFTASKDTFSIKSVKNDFPLKDWVRQMREGIYQPFVQKNLSEEEKNNLSAQYTESAWKLYEKLILPVKEMITDQSQLIIVPDGVLGYIPFDALLTSPVEDQQNFRDYPYLLKDYQTSIAYSATLLKEMRDKKHQKKPSKNFLAVAPRFGADQTDTLLLASRYIDISEDRNRLGPLRYNIPEAEALQEIVGGDILVDSLATENEFIKNAGDYRILHLSTHGKANDKVGDYSFLAFYEQDDSLENEWLYNRELYELNLNSDMVVLSACETGIGELQRGEGIISLARGFSYAGAKSIITSLWSVNDRQTPELMKSFYTNLKKGQSKDEALQQAKLDFLANSPNPEPYFWAAFIPIGDMAPIELDSGFPLWAWGLLGLALLGLIAWLIRRK